MKQPQFMLPRAAYFFYFAASAALLPYITLHYEALGMSGAQIGVLTGLVPLVGMFASSLWGALADATQRHRLALVLALVGAWLAMLGLSRLSVFIWMVPVAAAFAFFIAPVIPMIDNAVMDMLGEQRQKYGQLRLWGAVGWGLLAVVAGYLIERGGLQWAFGAYLIFLLGLLLVVLKLPINQSPPEQKIWQGLAVLLTNRQWQLFLFVLLMQGVSMSIFNGYLFLHMQALGASQSLMGLTLAAATASELPIWYVADRMIARWGIKRMLALSLLAWVIRAVVYGVMADPWLVVPVSLLHGISFSLMWTASVAYAAETAPKGMGATAQGVLNGVTFGLGGTIGGFAGGLMYQSIGAAAVFLVAAGALLITLVLFALLGRRPRRARQAAAG